MWGIWAGISTHPEIDPKKLLKAKPIETEENGDKK